MTLSKFDETKTINNANLETAYTSSVTTPLVVWNCFKTLKLKL